MQQLTNLYPAVLENCPEFLDQLTESIIKPLEDQGASFRGISVTGTNADDGDPVGAYTLIFDIEEGTNIPNYQDEGTISFHYNFFGTLYYVIPMPY